MKQGAFTEKVNVGVDGQTSPKYHDTVSVSVTAGQLTIPLI